MKIKNFKFQLPSGEVKSLRVMPVPQLELDNAFAELYCRACTYIEVCHELPDPLERDGYTFNDFCLKIGCDQEGCAGTNERNFTEGDIECVSDHIIAPLSIEECFKGDDRFTLPIKKKIDHNYHINTKQLVDTVCPEWCDDYNSEYSNCNNGNSMCILRKLFTNKREIFNLELMYNIEKDKEERAKQSEQSVELESE